MQWDKLAMCQRAAASGTYAMATASYIMWLAPQLDRVRGAYETERQRLRIAAPEGQHRRSADAVAQMAAAWTVWLRHAVEIGAAGVDEASRIRDEVWDALLDLAAAQEELQRATDPVERYRELIVAALSAGRAHSPGRCCDRDTPDHLRGDGDGRAMITPGAPAGTVSAGLPTPAPSTSNRPRRTPSPPVSATSVCRPRRWGRGRTTEV